jgi:hypothetical protein
VYLCANFMYMTETNNYAPNMGNQGAEGAEDTREDMNTDENISGFTHLNEMDANEEELDNLREELQQQKDKYLRLFAEFDNFRKRSARENMELFPCWTSWMTATGLNGSCRQPPISTRSGKVSSWSFPSCVLPCWQKE